VRLLRIAYVDSATGTVETTRYGFIIEDPAQMAERVGGKILDRKGATADDVDPAHTAMAYTFLYFIANTDVSFNGLHNGEIVTVEIPVSVELTVAETEPGIQGDRVSGARKPATLETGKVLQVPLFINIGDRVKVDTRSGDYITRV
jgi:hypothetical protein